MRYLVTGAPGWLGTEFIKSLTGHNSSLIELKNNLLIEEIRCLVHPKVSHQNLLDINKNLKCIKGDLTIPKTIEDFFHDAENSTLFHIAGIIHPKLFIKDIWDLNYVGTKNILCAAIKNKVKRIIVVSSNSPVGVNESNSSLFDESSAYNPYMDYGKSKMEMEMLVQESYNRGEIETVIIRPCWFYGPGQPDRQSLFFKMIREGKAPIVGNGENKRSMSYIENICQGLMRASLYEKANGQLYWIADKEPYTMNQIIDTIEYLLENEFNFLVKHKRLRLPNLASKIAFGVDWSIQKFGLYHQKIHVLSEMNKTIACSINKAYSDLDYKPKFDLMEGMRKSISWALKNNQII